MEYNWQITISEVPTRGSKANRADAWIVRHTQITVLRKQSGTEGRELIGKKKKKGNRSPRDSFPLASAFHPVNNSILTEDDLSFWKQPPSNKDVKHFWIYIFFLQTTSILHENEMRWNKIKDQLIYRSPLSPPAHEMFYTEKEKLRITQNSD